MPTRSKRQSGRSSSRKSSPRRSSSRRSSSRRSSRKPSFLKRSVDFAKRHKYKIAGAAVAATGAYVYKDNIRKGVKKVGNSVKGTASGIYKTGKNFFRGGNATANKAADKAAAVSAAAAAYNAEAESLYNAADKAAVESDVL